MSKPFYPRPWEWDIVDYDLVFYDANGVPIFSDGHCDAERKKAADWVLKLVNEGRQEPPE